jgi:hypothetical protein
MIADLNLPSLHQVIGWLVLITCISFGIGGIIATLDIGHYSEKSVENVTPVSISLHGAEKYLVALEMEQGSVHLSPGNSNELIRGTLKSRYSRSGPDLSYSCSGRTGFLSIRQAPSRFYEIIDKEDTWNLSLPTGRCVDLTVKCGVGDLTIDAGSLNLSSLQVDSGTGDVFIDLSSFTGKHLPVSVNAGVGGVKILLPPDSAVGAEIENGLGTRTISGLEGSDGRYYWTPDSSVGPVISLSVKQGIGDLTLTRVRNA